jgi:GNAT superfamily N-acetyltransferase
MEDGVTLELPAGIDARPATPNDVAAIRELVAACERADDGIAEGDEHDITVAFGRHGFDSALDMVLVFDDEELVGWADIYRGRGEGDVRPSHRGRGIGSALLGWIEARARALGEREVAQPRHSC